MSDIYEEYGLELEADDIPAEEYGSPDNTATPKKRKSGGWGKAIIAFFLGFIIAAGSIAGTVAIVLTQPARPTLETIGGMADFDYATEIRNKYLSEEWENESFLDILKELFKVVKNKNLEGVDNISPAVGDYLDKMINNVNKQFGVKMDTDTILKTEFAELPTYLGETFRTTPLADMLKATSKNDELEPILMEVCYGQEGTHYYIEETIDEETGETVETIVMLPGHEAATFETFGGKPNSLINNISLAAVLPPSADDPLMLSMAYGRENETFIVEKDPDGNTLLDEDGHPIITMLPLYFEKNESGEWVDYTGSYIICEVEEADENGFQKMTKVAGFVGGGTDIYYVKETYNDGKYYAYKAPADDAKPALFQKTMIGNMAEDSTKLINNIMLKDALGVHYQHEEEELPHPILFSLAYGTENVDYEVVKPDPNDHWTWFIQMKNGAQPRTIGDLRSRGNDIINDVAISDIMSAEPDDALGMYLLYGKKDIHYTLDADNNITLLQKYIAISDDGTSVYNEYGEYLHPDYYALDTENATFTDAKGDTYKYVISDPVKTVTANDGSGEVKVYYLTDMDGNAVKFAPHSLGELAGGDNLISRLTDRLTMSEVLGGDLSEHKLLKHVCDYPVSQIPDAISNLAIADMFSDEVYGAGAIKYTGETIVMGNYKIEAGDYFVPGKTAYKKIERIQHTDDTPIQDVENNEIVKDEWYFVLDGIKYKKEETLRAAYDGIDSIHIGQYTGDEPITDIDDKTISKNDYYISCKYQKAELNGQWKYLLTDAVDNSIDGGDYKPQDYTVVEMNMLLSNMTANVDKATLNDLHNDGIVSGLDTLIGTTIKHSITIGGETKYFTGIPAGATTLGELTVSEMLNYTAQIVTLPIFD